MDFGGFGVQFKNNSTHQPCCQNFYVTHPLRMAHTAAIQAFNGINNSHGGALISQLYGALVTIELLAKDRLLATTGRWNGGHDVCSMLVIVDGALASVCTQLRLNLERLHCTDRTGNGTTVSAAKYPDIRYLRHLTDAPAWPQASSDQMLNDALSDARLCLQQLKILGVAP